MLAIILLSWSKFIYLICFNYLIKIVYDFLPPKQSLGFGGGGGGGGVGGVGGIILPLVKQSCK